MSGTHDLLARAPLAAFFVKLFDLPLLASCFKSHYASAISNTLIPVIHYAIIYEVLEGLFFSLMSFVSFLPLYS